MPNKEFVEQFQSDVLNAVKEITYFTRSMPPKKASVSDRAACKKSVTPKKRSHMTTVACKKKLSLEDKKILSVASHQRVQKKLTENQKIELHSNAANLIKDRKLLKYICPALQGLTGDIAEVAKSLTIALVPLSLAGAITVPLNPYLYAMLAFVICKSGIEALCKNYKKNT
jgi:hypothetical protein